MRDGKEKGLTANRSGNGLCDKPAGIRYPPRVASEKADRKRGWYICWDGHGCRAVGRLPRRTLQAAGDQRETRAGGIGAAFNGKEASRGKGVEYVKNL